MRLEKLLKIAKKHYLNKKDTLLFVNFMSERFPNILDETYASEWANRIKSEKAMRYADAESMRILKKYK